MFNLFFLFRIAVKHWLSILLAAIIAGGSVFCYFTFLSTPKYAATGSIIVTNGAIIVGSNETTGNNTTINYTDVVTSLNFAETVADILEMPDLYKEMAHALSDKYTFHQLDSMSSVNRRGDSTLFFDITFTTTDPMESIRLVNTYLDITPGYINKIVNNSAATVQKAEAAGELMSNTVTMSGFAAIIGAVVYFIIFLIYSSDSIIRDEESFSERFDIPIIGVIPDFANAKSKEGKYYRYSRYYGYGGNKYAK